MNLELLDPFRRQIPDRVDATLTLPGDLDSRLKKEFKERLGEDQMSATYVAFNRRGAYIAVGYCNGMIGVFDILSRTLSGFYRNDNHEGVLNTSGSTSTHVKKGLNFVSWSRRSRKMVTGCSGDTQILVIDTTHPLGPGECCVGTTGDEKKEKVDDGEQNDVATPEASSLKRSSSSFARRRKLEDHHTRTRYLTVDILENDGITPEDTGDRSMKSTSTPMNDLSAKRYPSIAFSLPLPVGGYLQAHPKYVGAGLAVLNDGSIVAFWVPPASWEDPGDENPEPFVTIATVFKDESNFITYAIFDSQGKKVYAGTKEGKVIGFDSSDVFQHVEVPSFLQRLTPGFIISVPGRSSIWGLVISRNGQNLLVNSADGSLRLYKTKDCWASPGTVDKPFMCFQDVVSKVKFASCDLSGDSEFVVGGANGGDNKYELYIWNTSTGELMDKLTGATVDLLDVAWHPTRSFLAVATSDGVVDVWGPRINWTAFAPDFQALPQNVEYVECEDEFDVVDSPVGDVSNPQETFSTLAEVVDILTIEPVPVFASDSEDESDVFAFETKVTRILGGVTTA